MPSTQWSHPFPVGVQWLVSIVLAVVHLLTLVGFLGVLQARPAGRARLVVGALRATVAGYLGLAVAEVLSGAIGGRPADSSSAAAVGGVFGLASLLTAVGSIVAGVAIVRAAVWGGAGRWMVLASGVVMVVLVTPATITGSPLLRMVALSLWSLTFIPLGRTLLARGPDRATTHRAAAG